MWIAGNFENDKISPATIYVYMLLIILCFIYIYDVVYHRSMYVTVLLLSFTSVYYVYMHVAIGIDRHGSVEVSTVV